ncbi:uncharacterized protein LAESUDRAFT_710303 [Laetiporus sulphureus 93-53]|uniref:Uncharacterized protein n=1 Tax=Laetiporus sulphureus 93-53 TaxID=1314785 RepID=A0A165IMJ1_9APHY|nr:uncharacterized protein LAESUDRAFT_710303 [Laetiporus sulphureus 93-53]KZT13286.1 hypothetical protein LAESUDRAFT_710303 [Laetiporus sulphureus 93-53]
MRLYEIQSNVAHPIREAHRLNVIPPYYFLDLPKSRIRLIFCDKPAKRDAYANIVQMVDDFCFATLRIKKARKYAFTAVILSHSEISHVSETPMEPPHMLVKLTLPSSSGIATAIPAHVYLSGSIPEARIDTTSIFWKDAEEIAEHEISAMREVIMLPPGILASCAHGGLLPTDAVHVL